MDLPIGNRISRFWAAFTGTTAYLPLVIVDSGHQLLTGNQADFKAAFAALVDPELARPPAATIAAYTRQIGDKLRVYATLRNGSGVTLSAQSNQAALHALVYEDARVGVTGRIMRAAPWLNLTTPLANGDSLSAAIDTLALSGVNWGALHAVVAADYVPGPGKTFDMLQAAVAQPAALAVTPSEVVLGVDSGSAADRSVALALAGPYNLRWSATPDVPWLAVTPDEGAIGTAPVVVAGARGLVPGPQEGHVTLSATSDDGMAFTQFVTVTAVLGARAVQARAPAVTPGSTLALPIEVSALGDEHAVSFTLAFDPAFVGTPEVTLRGAASAATLTVDASGVPTGRLGVTVTLPAGQVLAGGEAEIAVVTFATAATVPRATSAIAFADEPVPRAIADAFGGALAAAYRGAALVFPDGSVVRVPRRHLGRPAG